jgi:hypothetical protein
MGPLIVGKTPGPWDLYNPAPKDDNLLRAYVNAVLATIGFLMAAFGIILDGDFLFFSIIFIISLMMAGFSYVRFRIAQSNGDDGDL